MPFQCLLMMCRRDWRVRIPTAPKCCRSACQRFDHATSPKLPTISTSNWGEDDGAAQRESERIIHLCSHSPSYSPARNGTILQTGRKFETKWGHQPIQRPMLVLLAKSCLGYIWDGEMAFDFGTTKLILVWFIECRSFGFCLACCGGCSMERGWR